MILINSPGFFHPWLKIFAAPAKRGREGLPHNQEISAEYGVAVQTVGRETRTGTTQLRALMGGDENEALGIPASARRASSSAIFRSIGARSPTPEKFFRVGMISAT